MNNVLLLLIIYYVLLTQLSVAFNSVDGIGKLFVQMGEQLNTYVDSIYHRIDEWTDHVIEYAKLEECHHYSRNGKSSVHNSQNQFQPNGCKTFGLQIKESDLPLKEMSDCCDNHELCYHECGSHKNECDTEFKNCLIKKCHNTHSEQTLVKGCETASKLLLMGVLAFGCKTFKEQKAIMW